MATLEELGGLKNPGDLIQSNDWMAVVNEVVRLGAEVERLEAEKADLTLVQALQTQVDGLQADLTTLGGRVDDVEASVASIRAVMDDYFQLTLSTTSVRYALGSQGTLTAVVRDLEGQRVEFAANEPRPWVDFVGTWGRLVPAPGFETSSRGGAGQRSLQVQVNREGEARVLVRAESAAGVSDEDEVRMMATMQAMVANGSDTVQDVILQAQTPVEAGQRGAWDMIRAEYDASDDGAVRRYLDTQYLYGRSRPVEFERNRWGQSFRDHRCTVMAFLKPDGDPSSPDQSRGVSSIQITFRDWFWSWVDVGYVPVRDLVEVDIRDDIRVILEELPPVDLVGPRIEEVFGTWLDGAGFVERERNIRILMDVMEETTLPASRPDAAFMFGRGRDALELQLQLDRGGSVGGERVTGGQMAAILGMSGRAEAGLADVGGRVQEQAAATEQVRGQVGELDNRVQFVGGQVEEAVASGGRLSLALDGVDNLRAEVDGIRAEITGPTDARVRDIQLNVQQAFERLALLEG